MNIKPFSYESFSFNQHKGQGVNQGQWFVTDEHSEVTVIAAKDAAPCVLVFIHGFNPYNNQAYAGVAHISVAERVDSLINMCNCMPINWPAAKIYLISGMSTEQTPLVQEILSFFQERCSVNNFFLDLGKKSTQAIMCVATGRLNQASIPQEQYPIFDLERYFRNAVIGLIDPKQKKPLESLKSLEINHEWQIILHAKPKIFRLELLNAFAVFMSSSKRLALPSAATSTAQSARKTDIRNIPL